MKTSKCFLIIAFFFILFLSCNDESSKEVSKPELSSVVDNNKTDIKVYRRIDNSVPGTIETNPNNFIEIIPIEYDGITEIKLGIVYLVPKELEEQFLEKFFQIFIAKSPNSKEFLENFIIQYKELRENGIDKKIKNLDPTKLCSEDCQANAIAECLSPHPEVTCYVQTEIQRYCYCFGYFNYPRRTVIGGYDCYCNGFTWNMYGSPNYLQNDGCYVEAEGTCMDADYCIPVK